ncbi:unnamed protein product [Linum trigynum]|uniref:Uncharacterized protein n=1 Tax=Linum trigynum TaxID=586398 RepID=A0AAV2GQ88_9ROSI
MEPLCTSPAADLNHSDRPPDPLHSQQGGNDSLMVICPDAVNGASGLPLEANEATMVVDQSLPETTATQRSNPLPLSYANAVTGPNAVAGQKKIAWTPVGEHDLITGSFNGEPELKISTRFKEKLCVSWQRTLVVRVLGLKISFLTFSNKIKNLWRPPGAMEILALGQECFFLLSLAMMLITSGL